MTPKTPRPSDLHIAESVGQLLARRRLELGLTTGDVAATLRQSVGIITTMESGGWDGLPDDIYTRTRLKQYVRLLRIDEAALLHLYRQERLRTGGLSASNRIARHHPLEGVSFWQMLVAPRLIRILLLAAVALVMGGYFVWSIKNIVTPPPVAVATPYDGFITSERVITVEGQTVGEVTLRINGKIVTPDSRGNFHDTLELRTGLNVIRVVGSRKHSRETVVTRRVIVQDAEGASIQPTP